MNPAMVVVWVTGPWLAWAQASMYRDQLADGQSLRWWSLLTGYHHALGECGARTFRRRSQHARLAHFIGS